MELAMMSKKATSTPNHRENREFWRQTQRAPFYSTRDQEAQATDQNSNFRSQEPKSRLKQNGRSSKECWCHRSALDRSLTFSAQPILSVGANSESPQSNTMPKTRKVQSLLDCSDLCRALLALNPAPTQRPQRTRKPNVCSCEYRGDQGDEIGVNVSTLNSILPPKHEEELPDQTYTTTPENSDPLYSTINSTRVFPQRPARKRRIANYLCQGELRVRRVTNAQAYRRHQLQQGTDVNKVLKFDSPPTRTSYTGGRTASTG